MERLSITHGMHVVDAKGRALGVVEVCGRDHLLARQGLLHKSMFAVKLLDVTNLEDGFVHLREGAQLLPPNQPDLTEGPRQGVLPFRRELLEESH